jgi:hypothetical protein
LSIFCTFANFLAKAVRYMSRSAWI